MKSLIRRINRIEIPELVKSISTKLETHYTKVHFDKDTNTATVEMSGIKEPKKCVTFIVELDNLDTLKNGKKLGLINIKNKTEVFNKIRSFYFKLSNKPTHVYNNYYARLTYITAYWIIADFVLNKLNLNRDELLGAVHKDNPKVPQEETEIKND